MKYVISWKYTDSQAEYKAVVPLPIDAVNAVDARLREKDLEYIKITPKA